MSCSIVSLPISLAWVIGTLIAEGANQNDIINDINMMNDLDFFSESDSNIVENYNKFITENSENIPQPCDDVKIISEKHFIEKSFETPFTDKNLLMKTLEEHGVKNITEEYGKISGQVDNYTLTFEKWEEDKPYSIKISCLNTDNPVEKMEDLNSEYTLNVQEEVYLNIIDNLKSNQMELEREEVLEDNTIVLTINLG